MNAPVLGATRVSLRPVTSADLAWLPAFNALPFHEPPVREVCYAIHPDHWGHGYAQEAMEARLRWGAHSRGLDRFMASVDEPNTRSHALLTRLGFTETHRSMGHCNPLRHYVRGGEDPGPPT